MIGDTILSSNGVPHVTADKSPAPEADDREETLRAYLIATRARIEDELRSRISRNLNNWYLNKITRSTFVDNCGDAFQSFLIEWKTIIQIAEYTLGKEKGRALIEELFPGTDYDST